MVKTVLKLNLVCLFVVVVYVQVTLQELVPDCLKLLIRIPGDHLSIN